MELIFQLLETETNQINMILQVIRVLRRIKAGQGVSVACAGGGGRAERFLIRFLKSFISNAHESRENKEQDEPLKHFLLWKN